MDPKPAEASGEESTGASVKKQKGALRPLFYCSHSTLATKTKGTSPALKTLIEIRKVAALFLYPCTP
jgi:hypothetical protein